MSRGKKLKLTRAQVQQRALNMIVALPPPPPGAPADAGNRPINYRLDDSGLLGGRDPERPHCADWSYGLRVPTSDCIGFALWASGIDRYQPEFNGTNEHWLNCRSLLDDAEGDMVFCRTLLSGEAAKVGDWLLSGSHIGVIVRPKSGPGLDHLVVDCSPRHGRFTAINTGGPWSGECQVIRPLFYAEP